MTAYLKAHYPVEFMAALLSSDIPGPQLQEEGLAGRAHRRLPADGHRGAAAGRQPLGRRVHRGRGQDLLRPLGHQGLRRRRPPRPSSPAAHAGGPYRSLFDFCQRLDPGTVNRAAIESLVKAGAFDSLGGRRAQWFAAIDRALQAGAAAAADRRSGQKGLFDDDEEETADGRHGRPARPARVGPARPAGQGEGSAGLLPLQPSAGRARKQLLAAYCSHTTVGGGRPEAPHRSDARRHDRRRSSSPTRRTPSPAAPAATPCSTWRTPTA